MNPDWKTYKVSEFADVFNGGTPSTSDASNFGGDIPWITPKDLSNYEFRFISKGERSITKKGFENSSATLVPAGTILLTSRAPVGYLAIAQNPVTTNQGFKNITVKNGFDNQFVYYLLKSNVEFLKSHASGSTFAELSGSTLKNLSFKIPPLPEQRAIADVLSALDDKIDLNRRMNATLESLAQALFKHMFLDNPERKGWEEGILGDSFNLTMGQSPPGSTYNESSEGSPFFQGKTDFGFRFPTNRIYCTAPTRYAKKGDTLVSVRAPVGSINVALEDCAIGRGVASIRHKTGSRSFTYYSMGHLYPEFHNFEMEGTVFGSINRDSFLSIKFPNIPLNIVAQFEEQCYPLDQKIENNELESRTLAELRDTLLPKLMSGQVRVTPSSVIARTQSEAIPNQ